MRILIHATITFITPCCLSHSQQADESNGYFIRSLHEIVAKYTGWDQSHKDDMLRIRLLAGMRDEELSRELQINDDITLE